MQMPNSNVTGIFQVPTAGMSVKAGRTIDVC